MSNVNRTRAGKESEPSDGWMLLHSSVVRAADDASFIALLHRLGLQPGNRNRVYIGGIDFEWAHGEQARSLATPLGSGEHRLLGIAAAPDVDTGSLFAFRVVPDARPIGSVALQRLCTLVGLVAATVDAESIGWLPAKLWSSAAMFGDAVVATERQGLPPVMHLVAFETVGNGIHTHGLSWFCGHELRLIVPSAYSESQALRRLARLAVDAMMHSGAVRAMTVAGIDKREVLVIGNRVDDGSPPFVPVELRPPPA